MVKFIDSYSSLINSVGFYVFFLGLLVVVVVNVSLLFEKERLVLPGIIAAILLVTISAVYLERRGPLLDLSGSAPKVVFITKEVKVPVPMETSSGEKSGRDRRTRRSATTPRKRIERRVAARLPKTESRTVAHAPEAPSPTPASAAVPKPSPQPQPEPKPNKSPPPLTAKRTQEGLVLPTGNLIIRVVGTMLMTVPKEATKARLSVIFDGRYVGGKGASSLRRQRDEDGNILNVTYFWKGVTIRLYNQPTGNHRVTVRLKISGNGVSKSSTAWSGAVYIGPGTRTIVLKGGWGAKLRRVQ